VLKTTHLVQDIPKTTLVYAPILEHSDVGKMFCVYTKNIRGYPVNILTSPREDSKHIP